MESKKKRLIKLIIVEILMVAAAVGLLVVLVLAVKGYRLGENWNLEQAGLVQIGSVTPDAEIRINGQKIGLRTTADRMLKQGEYQIRLTKDGYDFWERKIKVNPGRLTKINQPRLFLKNRKVESTKITTKEGSHFHVGPDRETALLIEEDLKIWQKIIIKGDEIRSEQLEFSKDQQEKMLGKLENLKWSKNSARVLVALMQDLKREWWLIDLKEVKQSFNLTKSFGLDFDQIEFANTDGGMLWALEKGNLREIKVESGEISKILADRLIEVHPTKDGVLYLKNSEEQILGKYQSGLKEGEVLMRFDIKEKVHALMGSYLGEEYLAISDNQKLRIFKGAKFGKLDLETPAIELELDFLPKKLVLGKDQRFILAESEEKIEIYDLDLMEKSSYQRFEIKWLDDFMTYQIKDGQLSVQDFDGTNKRTLVREIVSKEAGISVNNRWLYYLKANQGIWELVRERIAR